MFNYARYVVLTPFKKKLVVFTYRHEWQLYVLTAPSERYKYINALFYALLVSLIKWA
jgi:hypothetical protein